MKRGQIAEGIVTETVFGGKGRVLTEEREVWVKGVLPGQRVRFRLTKAGAGKAEGALLEVLERSPQESEPDCPHFGRCGGCALRTLSYEDQLRMKEAQVRAILREAGAEACFEGIKGSPAVDGYRNKMEFSFGDERKDGPLTLGLHRKGSYYDILTTDQCRIVDEDFRAILDAVLRTAGESGETYYHRNTHRGYFRHLVIRKGFHTGEVLVNLVTSSQIPEEKEGAILDTYVRAVKALPLGGTLAGILHTVNDGVADTISPDRVDVLYGQPCYHEELLGLEFEVSAFSFFQNNTPGAELLYETAREYIGDTAGKEIFDLYSGTGTIAQMLAPVAAHVTGVEIVEEAVAAARENAGRNGLANCSFIAGDVLKVLDGLPEKPDLIVLDPPREGVHPKALTKIAAYGADRIVYISCKPTSLPGDLAVLQHAGYRVERSCAIDMFCATSHVETVVQLSKGRWTSGGRPFSADRSGAETISSQNVRVEFSLEDMD